MIIFKPFSKCPPNDYSSVCTRQKTRHVETRPIKQVTFRAPGASATPPHSAPQTRSRFGACASAVLPSDRNALYPARCTAHSFPPFGFGSGVASSEALPLTPIYGRPPSWSRQPMALFLLFLRITVSNAVSRLPSWERTFLEGSQSHSPLRGLERHWAQIACLTHIS